MQQMQEPEGISYNAGYPESAGYSTYQNNKQEAWSQSGYGSQQKLQPGSTAKISRANLVLAILSTIASSFIMALSIALFMLTVHIISGGTIGIGGGIIAMTSLSPEIILSSLFFSLILLLLSVAGFVFSTIQLAMIGRKLKHARSTTTGNPF